MSPLTVPEVRRLLLARREPPSQRRLRQWWSAFRRRHQATARRCHTERRHRDQPPLLRGTGSLQLSSGTCELDDALWEQVAALLPATRRRGDAQPLSYRTMLDGILWVARTGASWHDLPVGFGPWHTVHATYYRWTQHGQWPAILALLQTATTSTL